MREVEMDVGADAEPGGGEHSQGDCRRSGAGATWIHTDAHALSHGRPLSAVQPTPTDDGSRATGQDMHRGPPRPLPSSLPGMRTTSTPACSSRALVSTLRS